MSLFDDPLQTTNENKDKDSIGMDSLLSIGQAEIIDSPDQFDQYMQARKGELDIDESQMLVPYGLLGIHYTNEFRDCRCATLCTVLG